MGEIHCPPMNGAAVLRHYHPQQVFAYTIMPTSAWCRPSVKGVVGRGDCRLGVGITTSFPRPEDQRQIIRRKSFTLPTSTVDEAALQMDLLDYDFTCSPRRARTPTVSSTVPDRRVTVWHK